MEQEKTKKVQSSKGKRHWGHHLLIFLVCFLAACVTWFVVMYAKKVEEKNEEENSASETVQVEPTEPFEMTYLF